jgi:uncharacterized protein
MSAFVVDAELRVGKIVEVAGSAIRIELDGAISELTRTHQGRIYPIGQFASVVKIHYGRTILFAYVRLLRMRSEIARELGHPVPAGSDDARLIEADLFAEGIVQGNSSLDLRRGVRHYPLPGQSAYLTTHDEIRLLYDSVESKKADHGNAMIPLGHYAGAQESECFADINKLFGLHCAVLGSTGAGKSATVAAILHALIDHKPNSNNAKTLRPRVVLIDPHGEYTKAFGNRAQVFRAYSATGDDDPVIQQLELPYWLLSAEEFRELAIGKSEFEATSENNIVFKAVAHARLVHRGWAEKAKDWSGNADPLVDPADPRATAPENATKIALYDADTPDPFSLDEFERHIRQEQGMRAKSGRWEAMSPSDFKSHASVLDKLKVLRTDSRLAFMMDDHTSGDSDLAQILGQFLGEIEGSRNADIRIIDISGLPNEVAGPLTAAIARLLFQFKVRETAPERERNPVLLICEEAHRYVPDTGLAEYQAAQKAIRRIAKEGRKYGLGLMLVSQRPADVERTVLSQCNTWIIMRLTNTTDQEYVARFLPDSLTGLSRLLPSLTRQEALFVGDAAVVPARITIQYLPKEKRPRSNDVSFLSGWSQPPLSGDDIGAVVSRWCASAPGAK